MHCQASCHRPQYSKKAMEFLELQLMLCFAVAAAATARYFQSTSIASNKSRKEIEIEINFKWIPCIDAHKNSWAHTRRCKNSNHQHTRICLFSLCPNVNLHVSIVVENIVVVRCCCCVLLFVVVRCQSVFSQLLSGLNSYKYSQLWHKNMLCVAHKNLYIQIGWLISKWNQRKSCQISHAQMNSEMAEEIANQIEKKNERKCLSYICFFFCSLLK